MFTYTYYISVVIVHVYVGFAANNISETYDAKIFSVATLLSSYLLYNSVKVESIISVSNYYSVHF